MSDARLTFFTKNPIACPVCGTSFYREELFTGRGRLIAGALTDELRRLYEPSKKFGEINPLVYVMTVCPSCYYSSTQQNFSEIPEETKRNLEMSAGSRKESVSLILDGLDFNEPRTLKEGAASFYLAMACYDRFPASFSPTFKSGLCALRAAWLFSDLHRKFPTENYDYVSKLFYHKARFFYERTLELEQNGGESVASVTHLGPDIDKNYGYDGVLYVTGLLWYKYGDHENPEKRRQSLENAKRAVARIFGMGKASREKPAAMLEKAKELYGILTEELKEESADAS